MCANSFCLWTWDAQYGTTIIDLLQFMFTVGLGSGVARAFPGGRLAHPENQNEEKNK